LRAAPAIPGLTGLVAGLGDAEWNRALDRLEKLQLVHLQENESGDRWVDAHPVIREHFSEQLKGTDAWREGHRRLYEYLCATTEEGDQPTLEDLQPLYQAVAHGCQAALQQEAAEKVFYKRTRRGNDDYATKKLGAFGSELGAVACFFEQPWNRVASTLTETYKAWVLGVSAYCLRALGRLSEARDPMRVSGEMDVKVEEWKGAAVSFSNLSELELTLGEVAGAVGDAEQSVTYADRSGDAFQRMSKRTTHADALHQAGRRAEAETRFREAEKMWAETYPQSPLMSSTPGFQYCDLLLADAERAAWQICSAGISPASSPGGSGDETPPELTAGTVKLLSSCRAVSQRAAQTLKWVESWQQGLLTIALDHLTLGRAALYAAILSKSEIRNPKSEIEQAVASLRRAGQQQYLPLGFLTRAWLRFLEGKRTGPASAQEDLDDAWEIADRGPMKLFMADIPLYRARLFFGEATYPWESPTVDLAAARKLIEQCGYGRRKEELEDAEAGLKQQHS
jgi:hypothetical protein